MRVSFSKKNPPKNIYKFHIYGKARRETTDKAKICLVPCPKLRPTPSTTLEPGLPRCGTCDDFQIKVDSVGLARNERVDSHGV
jgi:hypothetical protein